MEEDPRRKVGKQKEVARNYESRSMEEGIGRKQAGGGWYSEREGGEA